MVVLINILGVDEIPEGQRFVAIYGDMAGATLFVKQKTADGAYIEADGDILPDYWLEEAGYVFWMPLGDDVKLWFEMG